MCIYAGLFVGYIYCCCTFYSCLERKEETTVMQQSLRLARRAEDFCHYGLEMAARESKQNQRLPHTTNASLKAKRAHPKVTFTYTI